MHKLQVLFGIAAVMLATAVEAQLRMDGDPLEDVSPTPRTTAARGRGRGRNLGGGNADGRNVEVQPDYCGLMPQTGPCRALVRSYYYFPNNDSCLMFTYGGCLGNRNRFRSSKLCMEVCGYREGGRTFAPHPTTTEKPIPDDLPPECVLGPDRGTGQHPTGFHRYYYNYKLEICQMFTWTGYGGNGNNFETLLDCQAYCTPMDIPVTEEPPPDNNTGSDVVRNLPVPGCEACTIGHCGDLIKTAGNYTYASPYMQIYLGMQAQCSGEIVSVKFIDHRPRTNKFFFLSVWTVEGVDQGKRIVNMGDLRLTLHDYGLVRPNGQFGWQEFNVTGRKGPIRIEQNQYVGTHMLNWRTLFGNVTVPYTDNHKAGLMPTIVIQADQRNNVRQIKNNLPAPLPYTPYSQLTVDFRRPAFIVKVKPDNNAPDLSFSPL